MSAQMSHEELLRRTGDDTLANHPNTTIPTPSDSQATAQDKLANAKDAIVNSKSSPAQSTFDSVQNHPTVQSIVNGPVAQNMKDQAGLTQSEFRDLANSKTDQKTATGQDLTHYHSMFYNLLSWKNPRATGIVFSSALVFIFMTRFLNVLHYFFRFSYFVLGITAGLEVVGKVLFDDGLTSKMRPKKYWTVPKESIASSVDEIEQLLNFFVIEAQRIVYAENIYATIAVFLSALVSYGLIKLVPFWGLSLIFTCILFLAPLIYVQNQEMIDNQVENVTHIVETQASQLRDVTVQHTNSAMSTAKAYADEYTHKAQEYMNRRPSAAPTSGTGASTSSTTGTTGSSTASTSSTTGSSFQTTSSSAHTSSADPAFLTRTNAAASGPEFPVAPKQEPYPSAPATDPVSSQFSSQLAAEREPLINH